MLMIAKRRRFLWIWLLIALACPWQAVGAAPAEIAEFPFNRSVAVMHAKAAIEDFIVLMMKNRSLSAYDFNAPYTAAVMSKDCDKKMIKLVLVAFPDKKGEGWAFSGWEQNSDGMISRLLSVGFSVEEPGLIVQQARDSSSKLCE